MRVFLLLAATVAIVYCKEKDNDDDIWLINKKARENKVSGYSTAKMPKDEDMMEGDIVLTAPLKKTLDARRNGNLSPFDAIGNGAWPKGVVPYVYNRLPLTSRRAVDAAIAEYSAKTCIKFVKRRSERSYVDFFQGGGCYSMIGRQGGRQQISLGRGCGVKGIAIHEMMHALGFFHEQSRRDRDNYIRIVWANIPQRVRYNFEKYRSGQADTLGEKYDKRSIMHYGNYAFSTNGRKTIVSNSNPNERLGQRNGLSVIDVNQLKKYYKCGGVTTSKPTTVCKDSYNLCGTMASVGLCKVSVSWVRDNCKKSCKKCASKPRCKKRSVYCNSWATQYCNSGTYVKYMRDNCSECGHCV